MTLSLARYTLSTLVALAAIPTVLAGQTVDVGAETQRLIEADWIDQDRAFAARQTRTPRKANERGVTTWQDAAGGCDGVKTGRCGFHTASKETDPWWQVDLGRDRTLDRIVVYNRVDNDNARRTRDLRILVATDGQPKRFTEIYRHDGKPFGGMGWGRPLEVNLAEKEVQARVVRLFVPGKCSFALDEVEVYAADDPKENISLGRPADQKSVGPYSYPGTKGVKQPKTTPKPPPGEPFQLAHTREVLARARKLAERLRPDVPTDRLNPLLAELDTLTKRTEDARQAGGLSQVKRRELYLRARRLLRKIALTNLRLKNIDRLLFIKRRQPGGLYHMVHQYYGFGAKPGGGLFVLHDPFGNRPKLENLLAEATVERGRLKGKRLEPGCFLSPEASFDGKTIYFAYTECKAEGVEWSPRASFHIFRVRADGTGLAQLTDGPANDFDPCELPNGRIVFISGRRGGYLRCGGSSPPYHSPTYTLHSMNPDGSDIVCLSFHETQEWHPSVGNDGMIVYTRWDYVDRDTNAAHHIWTCYPDGRDPRSFHGNYPTRREDRPWMEMSIRAIPGSPMYVATAAAHHGLMYGSLVLIDPSVPDDGAMSQLARLTPDVLFPESECRTKAIPRYMCYGTPWPLSEDDFLCVYDRHARNRGIYWIDRDGNKELIYRDPEISCLSPIPLRPRPRPPVIPDATTQTLAEASGDDADGKATIAVMNIYDADFEWPAGAKVAALRIIQLLPKSTPRANEPRIGVANGTNARAVLGTVPVESDGSVHCEAPVGKAIYFQALDAQGMAIQSMRSVTYVHPGEQLRCQGCHEPKHEARIRANAVPFALRRPPSKITPGPEGSNPFSYVRLVQPVLDRHCVRCHQGRDAMDLRGVMEGPYGWTRSYTKLAGKYGFYFHASKGCMPREVTGGSRTVPGEFGARAAKLMDYVDGRHYDVKLSPADRRRITTWLDCNSEFYGVYRQTQAQARGDVVWPVLD